MTYRSSSFISRLTVFLCASLLCLLAESKAQAQVDAGTLLYLNFNNTLAGAQGETPSSSSGVTFTSGVSALSGNAAAFPNNSLLTYAASGNISTAAGTLEFFLKPDWNGNDLQTHAFLTWGVGGGAVFSKDGAGNLRCYFNRFGSEVGVATNVGSWTANQWYGVAYTWDNSSRVMNLYVNGSLATSTTFSGSISSIAASDFFLGSDNGTGSFANGAIDELRISSVARSASEIQARYTSFAPAAAPEPATLPLLLIGLPISQAIALCRKRHPASVSHTR